MTLQSRAPWGVAFLLAAVVFFRPGGASAAGAGSGCVIQGEAAMGPSTEIYDQAVAGKPIARFTGGEVKLTATDFPERSGQRAKISTGAFRIDGFVATSEIPVYTARNLAVHEGHLWIAAQRRVEIVGAAPGKLQVQRRVSYSIQQTFQAWTPCDALSLTPSVPVGWTPSGSERGYVVKKDRIEIFTGPSGALVTTLTRAYDGPGLLLWSTHAQGPWVRVEYHGDIVVDAWARAQDLNSLPPGETMDQLAQSMVQRGSPRLRVQGEPRVVRPSGSATLRAAASDTGASIGRIEPGTEIYVLDIVAGWASVLPKLLNIAPSGDGQFWAKTSDLGL
jgi:hypothetical protein